MERDPIRVLMDKHGWDFHKSRRLVRRACDYLKHGSVPEGSKSQRFEAIAALQALIETDHAAIQGLDLETL